MGNSTQPSAGPELAKFASTYRSAIGIDVHCQLLVCCYQCYDPLTDTVTEDMANFGTGQSQLQAFGQWCKAHDPQIVLMESTGVLWMSPYEALENEGFTPEHLALVNARDVKGRKGHKTDRNDAQHLAEIARLGAFRKSFVLTRYFRETRQIARCYWTTKAEYAREKVRYQKQLNSLGSRVSSVFSDVNGLAARQILQAFIQGDPSNLEHVVRTKSTRLKATPEQILDALRICEKADLRELLRIIDEGVQQLKARCERLLGMLRQRLRRWQGQLNRLMEIPGIKETSALLLLSELGDDLSSFPSIEKFCSWMGICPGNKISAGKSYSGATAKGNRYLRQLLTEIANGIALSHKGYLWQRFQSWKERRGRNRAVIAVAHLVARIVFVLLKTGTSYREDQKDVLKELHRKRLCRAVAVAQTDGFDVTVAGIVDRNTGELIPSQ